MVFACNAGNTFHNDEDIDKKEFKSYESEVSDSNPKKDQNIGSSFYKFNMDLKNKLRDIINK